MVSKVMTSIYLTPQQRRALARRAKRHRTTMSQEIRAALDKHVNDDNTGEEELQLSLVAGEANKAMAHMIEKLDEAHAFMVRLRKSFLRRSR